MVLTPVIKTIQLYIQLRRLESKMESEGPRLNIIVTPINLHTKSTEVVNASIILDTLKLLQHNRWTVVVKKYLRNKYKVHNILLCKQ